ncbi:hypothetical protein AA0119_g8689 [Alternaria tenuissima]|uniref:CFEM domain-containing protein n=1 Tax=Alternaria tenuissima TaxID=119927 RepID=A0ABY0G5Z6_9PLEO|nr:hypothetical protein AA0118_g10916 [Alternaria tenuissima]RYN95410.1 hypothetical protein AA0119_g8689 [Alternaria tenuissima]
MFFFLIIDLIAAVSQARARVLQIRDLSQCAGLCIESQGETSDCGIEDPNCSCANSHNQSVETCLASQCSESDISQAFDFFNDTCYCMRFLAG